MLAKGGSVRSAQLRRRITRSVAVILFLSFFDFTFGVAPAQAAVLSAPTITSITAGNTTVTVNMVTAGSTGNFWTYEVFRRNTSGCANPAGDGTDVNTASLSASFTITGLTNGCNYLVRVAANLSGVGNFAEAEAMPSNYGNFLDLVWANDAGTGVAGINRTPITSGCFSETSTTFNYTIGTTVRPGGNVNCNTSNFTGYFSGYIRGPITGAVTFTLSGTDDAGVFAIQGNTVVTQGGGGSASGLVNMIQNQVYRVEFWYHNDGGPGASNVTWAYSGVSATTIPSSSLANDPSVLDASGGCSLGMAARCAAGSALEIKQATGTNVDGQYWINIGGTPTLVYCIMNSSQGGGGWMLAMRGKNSASTFNYESALWTNSTLLNSAYPERFSTSDTYRNTDAKYAPFSSLRGGQILALYPEVNQSTQTGGAYANNSNGFGGPVLFNNATDSNKYGFAWSETYGSGMQPWTSFNNTTGFGGGSSGYSLTGAPAGSTAGPTGASFCPNTVTTLQLLFTNSVRCAFRQVKSAFDVNESPYSAVGNNIFFSQTNVRFFGINYGNANTGFISKARFGFGWNENGDGEETSNDGNGGIGTYSQNSTSMAAGTFNGCCSGTNQNAITNGPKTLTAGQTGMSGGDATTKQLGFELYVRNNTSASVSGQTTVRVTAGRSSSTTIAQNYSQAVTSGSATYRITPLRPGFSIDSTSGTLRVSGGLAPGIYFETVTATDANGSSGFIAVTINVAPDSRETDTALSFNGLGNRLTSSATYTNSGDFTMEAWVRPNGTCTSGGDQVITNYGNSWLLCTSGYFYTSFANASGGGFTYLKFGRPVRSNEWIHLAVVRSGNTVSAFINNTAAQLTIDDSSFFTSYTLAFLPSTGITQNIGSSGAANTHFNGLIDEVKVFNTARTINQIWNGAHTPENLSNANLIAYYDFNEGTGSTAFNRAQSASSSSDLNVSGPNWTSVASTTTSGAYTYVAIPRTLINTAGGWKVPSTVTVASVLVVGGGGGGSGKFSTFTSDAAGGGGGGVFEVGRFPFTPNSIEYIRVGTGGMGGVNGTDRNTQTLGWRGESTTVGALSAGGGGGAGFTEGGNLQQAGGSGTAGGGGGGANSFWYAYNSGSSSSWTGASGGAGSNVTIGGVLYTGRTGGLGAAYEATWSNNSGAGGGAGGNATPNASGQNLTELPGAGIISSFGGSPVEYGRGGTSGAVASPGFVADPLAPGNGGDGYRSTNSTNYGASGANGIVLIRYITALRPSYTKPVNANINVGMTETFTTNVSSDSATVDLTRTFRWESSTTGVNGTFSLIKQGTGAANASFSWIPTDTSTSGSSFVFRLIVTDSDTAGLFITDSSTAFAIINPALRMVGRSSITKTVGIAKSETYTVTLGTPTYSYTLTPDAAFFWLDTSTVGSPRVRISDTATVGTYFETLTVTDSVSASVSIPLTIVIAAPPSFSSASAVIDSSTVLNLDIGNSASYPRSGASITDISGRALTAELNWSSGTTAVNASGTTRNTTSALNNITCATPAYDRDSNGALAFNGSSTCGYVRNFGYLPTYTYETWIKRNGSQTVNAAVVANPNRVSGDQMNYILSFNTTNTLVAGIYSGTAFSWTPEIFISARVWTHVAVTYDGSTLSLIVNGETTTSVSGAITWNPAILDSGILIGRKYNAGETFDGSLASLRFYSRPLSINEIRQNYNATKGRFDSTVNENTVAKKYASRFVDTYTVTSGSETITATFTSSAISGLRWDTSTPRSLVLTLQDTLTPGTYFDTITATDVYGSSSNLPIIFTISRADTITVFYETPTAMSYTGNQANITPTLRVVGLVGLESGTATSATVRYKPGGTTCATGGYCRVGDIGPGGGVVFIDTSTASSDGRIYEVAPYNWSGSDDLATVATYCSNSNLNLGATQFGIGWGETNTSLARTQCLGGAVAKVNSFNQSNSTGFSDWFIPSTNEAAELIKIPTQVGLVRVGAEWTVGNWGYWTSTEVSASDQRSIGGSGSSWNVSASVAKSESTKNMVRPVRAFRSCWAVDTCTAFLSSSRPISAGGYHMVPSALTVGTGSLNNYQSVNYVGTPVTINRIAAPSIQVPWINTNYPDTFTINISIPAGSGALSFSTSNGTASGCTLDYRKIYTTSQGTCFITITRAADRNYLADTANATILFLAFVNSQPTDQVGSGSTIGLNGATSLETSAVLPPSITSLSTTTISLSGGGSLTITGTGFTGSITVKFWRNKTISKSSGDTFTISVSAAELQTIGATTGRISVITAAGQAVSVDSLTITP